MGNDPTTSNEQAQPVVSENPVPIVQQVATPPNQERNETVDQNTPGRIVLQWLTYAFWGWTVLSLSVLTSAVLANYISSADTSSFAPYGLAAVLVLLPISVICDFFYGKEETDKKTGFSSVVMIIHAVIFAIFGIASIIAAVFSVVSLLVNVANSVKSDTLVVLYSSIIIALLYIATFLRTIKPRSMSWIHKVFMSLMVVVVVVVTIFTFTGPIASIQLTRNDKLIESNLSDVASAINSYTSTSKALPSELSSLSLSGDTKDLITKNLVTYKKNTKAAEISSDSGIYYYQLCVSYKKASVYSSAYDVYSSNDYSTYVYPSSHPAGDVCYKLEASYYGSVDHSFNENLPTVSK